MYTEASLGLTDEQLSDLMAGKKIFLAKSQFEGATKVMLTGKQANTIATATRGVNLKFSPRQISASTGEGFLQDAAKAIAPIARRGVDFGLDKLQDMIPTDKLGKFKGVGDLAVKFGRKGADFGLDKIQKFFGGRVGIAKIDAKMGAGWFDQYLLPAVKTAAEIAVPLIKGRGFAGGRPDFRRAIDGKMGAGWFDEYLLPGLKTAAEIAVPLIRGRGMQEMTGEGWFDSVLDVIKTVAPIGIKLMTGRGWEPMDQKKPTCGVGLVL